MDDIDKDAEDDKERLELAVVLLFDFAIGDDELVFVGALTSATGKRKDPIKKSNKDEPEDDESQHCIIGKHTQSKFPQSQCDGDDDGKDEDDNKDADDLC